MRKRKLHYFGPLEFDGDLLFRKGSHEELPEKETEVLRELLLHAHPQPPRLVERERIQAIVGEHSHRNRVDEVLSNLKKVLRRGKDGEGREIEYVRTVHGRGFLFVCPVRVEETQEEARRLFVTGMIQWNRREPSALWEAKEWFELAVERDPTFARAHAAIGDCFAILGSYWWFAPALSAAKAKAAAKLALELDPSLAHAHATLGFVHSLYTRRWGEAEREFALCLERDPDDGIAHHWLALHLAATRQLPRALQEIEEARRCSPNARSIEVHAATIAYWNGDHSEALSRCETALECHPRYWYALYTRALVEEARGRFDDAVEWQRRAIETYPGGYYPLLSAALARALARAKNVHDAEHELEKAIKTEKAFFHVAAACEALGRTSEAFEYLDRALRASDVWIAFAAIDPRVARLRSETQFASVLEGLSLPPR